MNAGLCCSKNLGAFVNLLGNPVAVLFLSFIFGMMGNSILRRLAIYETFRKRYLFSGSKPYERLGVLWYRKVLLATPLRLFNTNIRFTANRGFDSLESVMMHMTDAEVAHWVGFAAMLVLNVAACWYHGFAMALAYLILNIFGNLYPCLLQQYNRHRLTRVITAMKVRNASVAS
jgi:hypothetical protein